jgi:hypothetical protein
LGGIAVAQKNAGDEPTLVERWLQDQQEWQRTAMAYLDSISKNEQFLTHLGNAMRGSLLAGKPYPTPAAETPARDSTDDRADEILHALHQIQGQLEDLRMSIDEMRGAPREGREPNAQEGKKKTRKGSKARADKKAPARRRPAKKRTKGRGGDSV